MVLRMRVCILNSTRIGRNRETRQDRKTKYNLGGQEKNIQFRIPEMSEDIPEVAFGG